MGRWFLADRATRPFGPGFKIMRAEMEKLNPEQAAASPPAAPTATPDPNR